MAEAVTPPPEPPRSPYASRFALLLAALAGLAIGAVALGAVLIADGAKAPDRSWSDWRPSGTALEDAQEIADHVAPSYRLADGRQLAIVTGGALELADLPAHLAVRSEGSASIVEGETVLFTLCGGGPSCSIESGRPSLERTLLLRREGLELALRSFHDLDGVDNVVVMLPPNREFVLRAAAKAAAARAGGDRDAEPEAAPQFALLFRRDQLETALDAPLEATLPPLIPTPQTIARAPETKLVDLVTNDSNYQTSIEQGQDATVFLVLDRGE